MKKWIIVIVSFSILSMCSYGLAEYSGDSSISSDIVSFTTIDKYAKSTNDLDEVADTWSFTSEALFSQSRQRLDRLLSRQELARIVREKEEFETFDNLRLRPLPSLSVDVYYEYKQIDDAQITDFNKPNRFNNAYVNKFGMAVQDVFSEGPYSFLLRGAYNRVDREGLIEYLPKSHEDVNEYEFKGLAFTTIDANVASLYATYVFQDIQQRIANPYKRDRNIFALLFSYGSQRINGISIETEARPIKAVETLFEKRFDTRGLKFFAGTVSDVETYGDVDVKRNEYFMGTSLSAWMDVGRRAGLPVDVTLEPDVFTSRVTGDPSQDNSQFRTNLTIYYQPSEPFVLMLPVRYDVATSGPHDFENWKAGVEVQYSNPVGNTCEKKSNTQLYASIRYDHQRFFNLDRNLDLFTVNIKFRF